MGERAKGKTVMEERVFKYLDGLRNSGETNMYGARPYIQRKFGLDKYQAGDLLSAWMKSFDGASQ